MSYATRKEAATAARHFKPTLPRQGVGWRTVLWDNLGWHFKFTYGPIAVYYHRYSDHWSCLISDNPEDPSYGAAGWSGWRKSKGVHRAAISAIAEEIRNVRTYIADREKMFAKVLLYLEDTAPRKPRRQKV